MRSLMTWCSGLLLACAPTTTRPAGETESPLAPTMEAGRDVDATTAVGTTVAPTSDAALSEAPFPVPDPATPAEPVRSFEATPVPPVADPFEFVQHVVRASPWRTHLGAVDQQRCEVLEAWAMNVAINCRSSKVVCSCASALAVGGGTAPIVGASLVAIGASGAIVPGAEQWLLLIDTGDGPTVPSPVLPMPSPDLAVRETTVAPFRLWRTGEGTIVELATAWTTTHVRDRMTGSQVRICGAGTDGAIRCGTFATGGGRADATWRRPVFVDGDGRVVIEAMTGDTGKAADVGTAAEVGGPGAPGGILGAPGRYTLAELVARGFLPERLDRADRYLPDHGPLPGSREPPPVVAGDPLEAACTALAEGAQGACSVARHLGVNPFPLPRTTPRPPVAGAAVLRWRSPGEGGSAPADRWGLAIDTGAGWWLAHRWSVGRGAVAVERFEQTWAGDRGTIFMLDAAGDGATDWLGCFAADGQPLCVRLPARRGSWSRTLAIDLGYHLVTRSERGRLPDDIAAVPRLGLDALAAWPHAEILRPAP